MDIWKEVGDKLIHKDPEEAKKVFDSIGSEDFKDYIVHSRLGYIWIDSDALFQKLIKDRLKSRKDINVLEIGSFVGHGANFFVKAFESINLKPHVDCIDLVYPYLEEGSKVNYGAQSYHLIRNTEEARMDHKINIHTGRSRDILPYLDKEFDFTYVDGEHTSGGVFLDLVLTFNRSDEDSLILVDDMSWYDLKNVGHGVEQFMKLYKSHIKDTYVKGSLGTEFGIFKVESYADMKKYKIAQLLFICKNKTNKSLDDILKQIKSHKLHLNPKINKGGSRKTLRKRRTTRKGYQQSRKL